MEMHNKLERLIEERKSEAAKKDISRKMRAIVAIMGFPLRRDGAAGGFSELGIGIFQDSNSDWWGEDTQEDDNPTDNTETKIETAEGEMHSSTIAMCFDGLSSGINMQITCYESRNLIQAQYQGRYVYREVGGQLELYLPEPAWEAQLESLFKIAERRAKMKAPDVQQQKQAENARIVEKVMEYLRTNWGF